MGDALAALAVEVTGFTRWFADLPRSEVRQGWTLHRCPHQIGGGAAMEEESFRQSVLARRSEVGAGLQSFDVVHVLDRPARPGAAGLAHQQAKCLRVVSIGSDDVLSPGAESGLAEADLWVADHPVAADLWRGRHPDRPLAVVPSLASLSLPGGRPPKALEPPGPWVVCCVAQGAEIDPEGVQHALLALGAGAPGLRVLVLGSGPTAEALRRRLFRLPGLGSPSPGRNAEDPRTWSGWLAVASVVALAAPALSDQPPAWLAWSAGVPVVPLSGVAWPRLAESLAGALHDRARFEREVRAGAALAQAQLGPAGVALGWLRVYLDGWAGARARQPGDPAQQPEPRCLSLATRTRLSLLPIGHREAYAAWYVRPEDWAVALEWLGPDAARSTLALRLQDITHLHFHGSNAHAVWDVDLAPGERFRTIVLNGPGRSLVGSLGMRSSRGVFIPLAHAGPTHLPRESDADELPRRSLRVLSRS